jgi:hypothetical protein
MFSFRDHRKACQGCPETQAEFQSAFGLNNEIVIEPHRISAIFCTEMNPIDLKQSRGLHKVELTLEADSILVFEKNLSGSKKTYVRYESISPKPVEITTNHKRLLVAAIIFSLIGIFIWSSLFSVGGKNDWSSLVAWILIPAIFWFFFFLSRKSIVRFAQSGQGLSLYKDRPSTNEFEDFVKKLFVARNEFLVKKHGKFLDEEDYAAKMNRLSFLREQEAITEQEFDARHKEFAARKKPPGPLGFAPQ